MRQHQSLYTVSVNGVCVYVSHDPNIELQGWAHLLNPQNKDTYAFTFQSWENRYPEEGYNQVDYIKVHEKQVDASDFISTLTQNERNSMYKQCAKGFCWPDKIVAYEDSITREDIENEN